MKRGFAALLAAASLCSAGCGTDTSGDPDAGPAGSCSIVGTFKNTTGSGGQATMVVSGASSAGTFTLAIVTSSTTINLAGNFTVSGAQITMTNTSSSPSTVQGCIGEAAVYALAWNGACTAVTLNKVTDACSGRIADANGATLNRQ